MTPDEENNEELPPPPRAEVGRYRKLKAARERALVVASMDLPHWIEREGGAWALFVEEGAREPVAAALAEFESEERERTDTEKLEPLVIPKLAVGVVLAVMVVLFRVQAAMPAELVERGVASDGRVLRGEWWRCLTALTLHGGTEHLISNLGLAVFAFAFVFARFGVGAGLLGTVLGGALGNLLNAFAHMVRPHQSIGSSTALFASLGLLAGGEIAALLMHRSTRTGWRLLVPIGAGFAFLALYGGAGTNRDGTPLKDAGNVDVMAHLLGLVAGLVIGGILFAAGMRRGAARSAQTACGVAALAALGVAWLLAIRAAT